MEGPRDDSAEPDATFTVALWRDPASPAPRQLHEALSARGIIATPAFSPFIALAILCRGPRPNAPKPQQTALIIVNPDTLPDAAALCDAAARYAPQAKRWMYGPAPNPQLRAIVETDVERWRAKTPAPEIVVRPAVQHRAAQRSVPAPSPRPQPAAGYRARQPAAPPLRLSGEGPLEPAAKPADGGRGDELAGQEESRPGSLLTPEELRMLLGEDEPGKAS